MARKKSSASSSTASSSTAAPIKRFFISYAHGNPDDEELARWLHTELTAKGHEAFLDVRMKLGTRWKDEIPLSIARCDVFIVLVSEKSVNSDAVHEEARTAHERHCKTGQPLFAPIRVRFSGDLGFALGVYVGWSQWGVWQSAADSPTVLRELMAMASGADAPAQTTPVVLGASAAAPRRRPIVELDTIPTPGGPMAPDHPMYLTREADQEALSRVKRQGETLVLLGPRQTGKSTLLNRCLEECRQRNKHFASVDFSLFDTSKFETLPVLLRELAKSFLRELGLTASVDLINSPSDMKCFVEDHIIKAVGGPVVLVIDEVDKVFERTFQHDFFGMIRGWHNARGKVRSLWENVDLILAISTEPNLLIKDPRQSPFSISPPIRLGCFDLAHTQTLNDRYGCPVETNDISRLHSFTGGHPFLIQLAMYALSRPSAPSFIAFLHDAHLPGSIFEDHLRSVLAHLQRHPALQLLDGLRGIIRIGQAPAEDVAYRLQAVGLVRREENRVVPSNELYARFFGEA